LEIRVRVASYDDIFRRMLSVAGSATAWAVTVYRNSAVPFANENDLLTGNGSFNYGGRWNPRSIATVYCSLTPEAAMAEALSHFRYYGWDIADAMPRLFVAIDVSFEKILDLTEGSIRQRLSVSMQRIIADDWRKLQHSGVASLTQMIGKAASLAGLEGLLVPCCSDPTKKNLVWFPRNLSAKSKIAIRKPDELPA
jgi:RES domain-containing protein